MLYICRKSYLTFDGRSDYPESCGQTPCDPGVSGVVMEDLRADMDGQRAVREVQRTLLILGSSVSLCFGLV